MIFRRPTEAGSVQPADPKRTHVNACTSNRIIIDPVGGLANRLRAIRSAMFLADVTDSSLELAWGTGRGCNCDFNQLFEVPHLVTKLHKFYRPASSHDCAPANQFLDTGTEVCFSHADVNELVESGFDFRLLAPRQSVLITTYIQFFGQTPADAVFVPRPDLRELIEHQTAGFGPQTVGIHIRRTDNTRATHHSPTAAFLELMKATIQERPETTFFVATDDPREEHTLRQQFGSRIITFPKQSLDRNNPQAIKDAVVDLFCLAACTRIIGSHWSSFTRAACALGGQPLATAMASSPPNHRT